MAKETPQEIEHIWRAPDGTIVGQDPRYDNEMTNQGYVPATDAEADDFVARSKGAAREAYEAPETPERPSANVPPGTSVEPPVDTALVKKIKDSAAAVGVPVSDEEALQRARNVARLTADQPNYPVARQGDVNEFIDPSSQVGTALEGVAGGLSLGILPFVEGLIGDFAEELGAVDNPFTSANIQRRKEANPTISLVSDIGASLTQGGASILKTAAPAAFARAPAIIKALAKADIAGEVGTRLATRTGARLAGTTLARETAATAGEIGALEARVAAGQALSKAEQEVLDVYRARSAVGLGDKAAATLTKVTPKVATKTAAEVASERAIRERTAFVVQEKLARTFEDAGYTSQIAKVLAQGVANVPASAGAGAVAGGVRAGFDKALEQNALTREQIEASGDSVSAAALRGVGSGGLIGGGLSLATPLAFSGLSAGLNLVSKGLSAVTKTVAPTLGSFLQKDVGAGDIRKAVEAADIVSQVDFRKETDALLAALQYQYDNAADYLTHLQTVDNTMLAGGGQSILGRTPNVNVLLGPVRSKFMFRRADGTYAYDRMKVREALAKQALVDERNPVTGQFESVIKLPPEIDALQDEIGQFEAAIRLYFHGAPPAARSAIETVIERGKPSFGPSLFAPKTAGEAAAEILTGAPVRRYDPFGSPEAFMVGPFDDAMFGARADAITKVIGQGVGGLQQTAEIGIPALLAQQAGLSVPEALGGAVVIAQMKNLLLNPATTIENYQTLQTLVNRTDGLSRNLARFLTNSGEAKVTATKAIREIKPLEETLTGKKPSQFVTPPKLTNAAARQLYDVDRELLNKLGGADAAGNIDDVFGGDYDALDAAYPVLAQNLMGTIPRQVAFLNEKMKAIPADREPTRQELFTYGMYSRYTRDPDLIYQDIAEKSYVPSQALEVMEKVYPASLQRLRTQLFEQLVDAAERKERIPAKQQTIIDTILGKKTGGLSAEQIKNIQTTMPVPTGKAGPISTKLPQLEREGLPR